jgi:hypothetical protein
MSVCASCGSRIERDKLGPDGRCPECERAAARWTIVERRALDHQFGIALATDAARGDGTEGDVVYIYCAEGTAEDVARKVIAFLNGEMVGR